MRETPMRGPPEGMGGEKLLVGCARIEIEGLRQMSWDMVH